MRYWIRRGHGRFLVGLVLTVLVLSGCGPEESSGSGGATVKFGAFTWDAAAVTTRILVKITEKYPELGVEETEVTNLDPPVGWAGLNSNDLDVLAEVWFPNQKPLYQKYEAQTTLVSQSYPAASQGWFVPSYVVEQGGAAPGLKNISQLGKYAEAFDGKLYDGPQGWVSTEWNTKRLKGYGLADQYEHVTASETAYMAELEKSYRQKEPMLLYLWRPHWAFSKFDLTQLEESRPYEDGCLEQGSGNCAMPETVVNMAARKDLKQEAPKFYAFLEKFRLSIPMIDEMLYKTTVEKQPIPKVAEEWVNDNKSDIEAWIGKGG